MGDVRESLLGGTSVVALKPQLLVPRKTSMIAVDFRDLGLVPDEEHYVRSRADPTTNGWYRITSIAANSIELEASPRPSRHERRRSRHLKNS